MSIKTEANTAIIAVLDAKQAEPGILRDASGNGHDAEMIGIQAMNDQADLVERPFLFFDGNQDYAFCPAHASLNPSQMSLSVWFHADQRICNEQVPLAVKSAPAHADPYYQYGLVLFRKTAIAAYAAIDGKLVMASASNVVKVGAWQQTVMTFDGQTLRLYCDGKEVAATTAPGALAGFDTPLVLGAYANLPKTPKHSFKGSLARVVLEAAAASPEIIVKRFEAERSEYPAELKTALPENDESRYAKRINAALRENRDVWSEELIERGGLTYDAIKDFLQPLFYSTGESYQQLGVHSLTFGADGGEPPYIVALADGSRLVADQIGQSRALTVAVGPRGAENFGQDLDRLSQPRLAGGYYPILQTDYRDSGGIHYRQESFAGSVEGVDHLVAFLRITAEQDTSAAAYAAVRVGVGGPFKTHIRASSTPIETDGLLDFNMALAAGHPASLYLLWSPQDPLPTDATIDAARYAEARRACQDYWDAILDQGATFDVPEPLVMDVKRNLLIQNRIMRWRYSIGAAQYHNAFYQPESSDTMTVLGYYAFTKAAEEGLNELVGMSKGEGLYLNWERGEKLSHAAHHYHLTGDAALIRKHTPTYMEYLDSFKEQMDADPNGLLRKERFSGDIPEKSYCTFHQAVCWRGMRDIAEVWRLIGEFDLHKRYAPLANRFKTTLLNAIDQSSQRMPDGSLFVNYNLLEPVSPFTPITETRLGSYWNLCMPYAFASGLWEPGGQDLHDILDYLHGHGAILLGLLRFNYYPTPIGSHRSGGLPGYRTTGFDNVYLLNYLRMLADNDQPNRLVASFYGKLAHGQTRGTFVSGEGDTVGPEPYARFRSSYTTPNSANNSTFLLALRLMLVRESFDHDSGAPAGLHLAMATPREWLAHGKRIVVRDAPTCFGPVSFTIDSELDANRLQINLDLPARTPTRSVTLRLRTPGRRVMTAVTINGQEYSRFDSENEMIDLSEYSGNQSINVSY